MAVLRLIRAYQASRGTALRPAILWQILAVLLLVPVAYLLALAPQGLTPRVGVSTAGIALWSCLSMLASLASLLAILNARRPGNGAWAWLCLSLVVVSLVPWLEQGGFRALTAERSEPPRLDFPWNLFYILLAAVVVTNHAPTRSGRVVLGILLPAVTFQLGLLILPDLFPSGVAWSWLVWPCALSVAILLVGRGGRNSVVQENPDPLQLLWLWFRDRWGAVWGLRILDRFNREAIVRGTPTRLQWDGPRYGSVGLVGDTSIDNEARILLSLLHRFADRGVLESAAGLATLEYSSGHESATELQPPGIGAP